jgi:hypothetical protein
MQSKPKIRTEAQTRKPFQWGISSTSIRFMQANEVEAAREGTTDCSKISPLPSPRRKTLERGEGQK